MPWWYLTQPPINAFELVWKGKSCNCSRQYLARTFFLLCIVALWEFQHPTSLPAMTLRGPFLSLALQNNPLTLLGLHCPISHLRWVGHAVDWKPFFTNPATLEASLSACNSLWFLWSKQHIGLHSVNLSTLIDKYSIKLPLSPGIGGHARWEVCFLQEIWPTWLWALTMGFSQPGSSQQVFYEWQGLFVVDHTEKPCRKL